ncbi:MAG: molybdopterin-guanine dinucleotide biosynthesis protein B [Actinomycetota bacterium]
MRVFGITGRSGSGKTTLMVRLLPWLRQIGISVSTVKQAHERFDVDQPGKDSYEHRMAGAREVMVASARRWALMHEYRDHPEYTMDQLLARMTPVDLVLVEGFRTWAHDRIEVVRASTGRDPLYPGDKRVVAVASDGPLPDCPVPVLDLDDVEAIGRLVLKHTKLEHRE